jgi:hypothetical protein
MGVVVMAVVSSTVVVRVSTMPAAMGVTAVTTAVAATMPATLRLGRSRQEQGRRHRCQTHEDPLHVYLLCVAVLYCRAGLRIAAIRFAFNLHHLLLCGASFVTRTAHFFRLTDQNSRHASE